VGPQAHPAALAEIFERQMAQLVQVAEGEQALADLLVDLRAAAAANVRFAEVWIIYRQVEAIKTDPVTARAVRVAGQVAREWN